MSYGLWFASFCVLIIVILVAIRIYKIPEVQQAVTAGYANGVGNTWQLLWKPVLGVSLALLLAWVLVTLPSPSVETVWDSTRDRWLWILIIGGALFVYSFFLPKEKENVAKGLQWFAGLVIVLFFVVAPASSWVKEASLPKVTCPNASGNETRSCVINASWTAPLKPASESGLVGKHLCSTPEKPAIESKRIVNKGGAFWIFRAAEGQVLLRYRFMNECPQHELPS